MLPRGLFLSVVIASPVQLAARCGNSNCCYIPNGAIEKEISFQLSNDELVYYLDSPNFETPVTLPWLLIPYF